MALPTVALRLDEANELAHAWARTIAEGRGIRLLGIKGPALHQYGLRDPRVSADIDVLIEPARFGEFCDALVASGWQQRPGIFISDRTTLHSRTYLRDGWPCDVDVHSFYPGFLAAPADVFEALWARRAQLEFAHHACDVPDRASSILVLALHSLRGSTTQPRHRAELDQLYAAELTAAERNDLAGLALETGCAATLQDVLARLGVDVAPAPWELASPDLTEWRGRVAAGSQGAYFWLVTLRRAPWREIPMIALRAIWPTHQDLLIARPEIGNAFWAPLRGRVARWGRGMRSLPGALRGLATARRRS